MKKLNANLVYMGLASLVLVLFLFLPQWRFFDFKNIMGIGGLFGCDTVWGALRAGAFNFMAQVFGWLLVVLLGKCIWWGWCNRNEEKITAKMNFAAMLCGLLYMLVFCCSFHTGGHPSWVGFPITLVFLIAYIGVPKYVMENENLMKQINAAMGQK